uniref:NADH-ubiquinone oxidoreductase chain 2 n=1 Tax=Acrocrypta assamensis TaxID=715818 RepID=A0A411DA11_9CUCU|nr:NADH dehydrogenase subunit 2 [Acrocrypta assamensis]
MLKWYKILFFHSLLLGSFITISAYSCLNMWIGLEINLLSMIPLMISNKNIFPAEAAIKYFIIQTLASALILFSFSCSLNLEEINSFMNNKWLMLIFNIALFTKLGAAPFHAWLPEVMEGLNWMSSFIIMSWQKLAPMILVMYSLKNSLMLNFIVLTSVCVGGILGLNQISLRKIFAYSSITHTGWMLAGIFTAPTIWFIYFFIYSILMFNLIYFFDYFNLFNLHQLFLNLNSNKMIKVVFIFNFLSFGGLPPFLGFLPKWLVMSNLIYLNFYTMSFFLIVFTLITLFFYIRILFSIITFTYQEIHLIENSMNDTWMISFNFCLIFSLLICTSLFNFL